MTIRTQRLMWKEEKTKIEQKHETHIKTRENAAWSNNNNNNKNK